MTEPRRLRVLLVDDEPDLLALLQAMLTMRAWEVIGRANSGEDAIRIAEAIAPDLVIVDYMMPGLDGFETAERLKAIRPDCEVLLFSALDLAQELSAHPAVDRFLRKGDVLALDRVLSEISAARRFEH